MQTLFKKYFFVVNLLFIAAAAYLLARAGNIFVGHFLTPALPEATALAANSPKAKPRDPAPRSFAKATDRNIIGAKREALVEEQAEVVEDDQQNIDANAEAVATTLNLKLIGTTVFLPAEWSLASIEDLSAKDVGIYSVNACDPKENAFKPGGAPEPEPEPADDDEESEGRAVVVRSEVRATPCNRLLDTATIITIEVDRVVFLNEQSGRKEYLDFNAEPKPGAKVAARSTSKSKKPKGGPTGAGIKKISANSYEIQQSEIDATLNNLSTIATQARIVPSFKDGSANGFKLFSIRPGSLYSKIGIKNGDVVQRINGYEISSPDKALEIYTKLKNSKQVTVDLLRRGKPQTLDYSVVQ